MYQLTKGVHGEKYYQGVVTGRDALSHVLRRRFRTAGGALVYAAWVTRRYAALRKAAERAMQVEQGGVG